MPSLTILICTHDRAGLLQQVLDSLNAAARPSGWEIDILVVANACQDGTEAMLAAYRERQAAEGWLPLSWMAESRPGKSHALNTGLERVTSDIVFLEDDDQRVANDFLLAVCRAAESHPDVSMFCGRLLPDWTGTEPDWIRLDGKYRIYPGPIPEFNPGDESRRLSSDDVLPSGGNLILRTNAIRRVGNFSTDLGPKGHNLAGGEDTAYIRKALALGESLMYVPDILQFHYADPTRLELSYLFKLAFKRTHAVVRMQPKIRSFPLYVMRKLGVYFAKATFTLNPDRRRFYLVRTVAAAGEALGLVERRLGTAPSMGEHALREPGLYRNLLMALAMTTAGVGLCGGIAAVEAAGVVSAFVTAILMGKSLMHFSRTGPQIRDEIRQHYVGYSILAMLRLGVFAFATCMVLATIGLSIQHGVAVALRAPEPPSFFAMSVMSLVSILWFTALQFCRHLLHIPASLEASSNYRLSRFYPLWATLRPGHFSATDAVTVTLIAVAGAAGAVVALTHGDPVTAFGVASFAAGSLAWIAAAREGIEPPPCTRVSQGAAPNILLIGSDGLRADSVGPRGGASLTPSIDRIAAGAVQFTNCFVPCARTAPSLISMMTSRWPYEHGIRDNFATSEEAMLGSTPLPGYLRANGYHTLAISDWCGSDLGKFELGFEELDLPEDQWNLRYLVRQGPKDIRLFLSLFTRGALGRRLIPEIHYLAGIPMTATLGRRTRKALSHFALHQDRPFFLNVFMSSTHAPFGSEYPFYMTHSSREYLGDSKFVMHGLSEPFEVVRRQGLDKSAFDLEQIGRLYAGCVAAFDAEVGKILHHLDACGLAGNTIVVIYSDHGMEFFERETWGQGNSVIVDDSARVPLIVADPRNPHARTVDAVVRTVDLAPTLLDLVGLKVPDCMCGAALTPALDGHPLPDLPAYSETGVWVTQVPSLEPEHLNYPDLPALLEVPDKNVGTIALKPEWHFKVVSAKDRMLRNGKWKLVRQPMRDGAVYRLFDVESDPACTRDIGDRHPEILGSMRSELDRIVEADLGRGNVCA